MMKNTGYYFVAVALALLATSRPAHAYLDPGVGSYAIQMILAGIFGGFVAFRTAIFNLIARLRGNKADKTSTHPPVS